MNPFNNHNNYKMKSYNHFYPSNDPMDHGDNIGINGSRSNNHPFLRNGYANITSIADYQRDLMEAQGDGIRKGIRHPLRSPWTFWYLEKENAKTWEDMQNEVATFETVEDFWGIFYLFRPPSELKAGSDYSVFKKGIRPMWEDPANVNGGRWVLTLHRTAKVELDHLWLDTLLCIIGESIEEFNDVTGAVVNVRNKYNKISVWTSNGADANKVMAIGARIKEALHLTFSTLSYELHAQTANKTGNNIKPAYVV